MSFKINQKHPERRREILARRNRRAPHRDETLLREFLNSRYIPGKGPHHRLGRKNSAGENA